MGLFPPCSSTNPLIKLLEYIYSKVIPNLRLILSPSRSSRSLVSCYTTAIPLYPLSFRLHPTVFTIRSLHSLLFSILPTNISCNNLLSFSLSIVNLISEIARVLARPSPHLAPTRQNKPRRASVLLNHYGCSHHDSLSPALRQPGLSKDEHLDAVQAEPPKPAEWYDLIHPIHPRHTSNTTQAQPCPQRTLQRPPSSSTTQRTSTQTP